jgi:hypothetical protein
MEAQEQPMEPYPLWDDFNIDIVVKVFSHTALSEFKQLSFNSMRF